MRAFLGWVTIGLLAWGCDCGGGAAPDAGPRSSAVAEPPSEPTVEETAPAPAPEPAARRALTDDERLRVRLLVAVGRDAAGERRWDQAMEAFDRALTIAPFAPRLLCEAGYVAHLAGRDAVAARRLDLALSIHGDLSRLAPERRVPVAMCLYNRGLVAEANEDLTGAVDHYRASLALRENAAVRRRLGAIDPGAVPALPPTASLGGHPLRERLGGPFVVVSDVDALEEAISVAFSGMNDFAPEGGFEPAAVELAAETALAWDAVGVRAVRVYTLDDGSVPLANRQIVLAFEADDGYALRWTEAGGYDNTDHGVWGGTDTSDIALTGGATLRLGYTLCSSSGYQAEHDWDAHPELDCYVDASEPTVCRDEAVICAAEEGAVACAGVPLAERTTAPGGASYLCYTESGSNSELAPEDVESPDAREDWSVELAISGAQINLTPQRGEPPRDAVTGARTLAELLEDHALSTRVMLDSAREAELERYRDEMDAY